MVLSANLFLLGVLVLLMSSYVTVASILTFLILTRGVGQSALSTTSVTSVGKWFTSDRLAKAMAAFSLLVAIGFAAAIVASQSQIESVGWSSVWRSVGIAVLLIGVLSAVLARDSPLAQGEKDETSNSPRSLRLGEALRSACFWIFAFGMALYGGVLAAVSLFNESILQELGFGADDEKVTAFGAGQFVAVADEDTTINALHPFMQQVVKIGITSHPENGAPEISNRLRRVTIGQIGGHG